MPSDPPPAPNRKQKLVEGLQGARKQAVRGTSAILAWLRRKAAPQAKKIASATGKKAAATGRKLVDLGRGSNKRLRSSLSELKNRKPGKTEVLQAELLVENDPPVSRPDVEQPPVVELTHVLVKEPEGLLRQ